MGEEREVNLAGAFGSHELGQRMRRGRKRSGPGVENSLQAHEKRDQGSLRNGKSP